MAEKEGALTIGEVAELLGVSSSAASGVLTYMEALDIVRRVRRGKTFYFLKGAFDERQIEEMLPVKRPKPKVHAPRRTKRESEPAPEQENPWESYIAYIRESADKFDGPSALGILGLTTKEQVEQPAPTPEPLEPAKEAGTASERLEKHGTVERLPKDMRPLTVSETRYLKDRHLKGMPGYEVLQRFNAFFAKTSNLERGYYGNIFYVSIGTNPWDKAYRVELESPIYRGIALPNLETRTWDGWKGFLEGIKKREPRYTKDQYDGIIDAFLKSGCELVEITVEGRTSTYLERILKRRIEERGLEDDVEASRVNEWVYLEKVK
jgi:hypothetical protein